jgi:hypothetical protein
MSHFENAILSIQHTYQKSWIKFFLKFSFIGKILNQDQLNFFEFMQNYLKSNRLLRWWFRSMIKDENQAQAFMSIARVSEDFKKNQSLCKDVFDSLMRLSALNVLDEIPLDDIIKHRNLTDVVHAMDLLSKVDLLNQENIKLIFESRDASYLARTIISRIKAPSEETPKTSFEVAYKTLIDAKISNPPMLNLIQKHERPAILALILRNLKKAELLNDENIIKLIDPENKEVLDIFSQQQYYFSEDKFKMGWRHYWENISLFRTSPTKQPGIFSRLSI